MRIFEIWNRAGERLNDPYFMPAKRNRIFYLPYLILNK